MSASVPQLSTNSFDNSAVLLGQLAQAINSTRTITGTLGGSSAVGVGTRVLLDTTVTTPGVVKFLPCPDATPAFGVIIYTPQEGTINPGDQCEVSYSAGNCIVQVGNGTLTPGTTVGLASGFLVANDGSHAQMGLLIDYVTQSTAGRVLIGWSPV